MRAWQVQGAGDPRDVLRLVDAELPTTGPGEVRDALCRSCGADDIVDRFAELPDAIQRMADGRVVGKLVVVL
jgi:hypothetical protein